MAVAILGGVKPPPLTKSPRAVLVKDTGVVPEADPAIANGLMGKLLVDYWWPADGTSGSLATPYAAAFGLGADR